MTKTEKQFRDTANSDRQGRDAGEEDAPHPSGSPSTTHAQFHCEPWKRGRHSAFSMVNWVWRKMPVISLDMADLASSNPVSRRFLRKIFFGKMGLILGFLWDRRRVMRCWEVINLRCQHRRCGVLSVTKGNFYRFGELMLLCVGELLILFVINDEEILKLFK